MPPGDVAKAPSGKVIGAPGWHILNALQVNHRSADLARFQVPAGDGYVKNVGISEAYVGRTAVTYDRATDTLTDSRTHVTYRSKDGYFVATDGSGRRFDTGWKVNVGLANFRDLDHHWSQGLSFRPGEKVVLAVSCQNDGGRACTPAASFTGRVG